MLLHYALWDKVSAFLYLIKHHAMNRYGKVEVQLHPGINMGMGQPPAGLNIMKEEDLCPSREENPNSQVSTA